MERAHRGGQLRNLVPRKNWKRCQLRRSRRISAEALAVKRYASSRGQGRAELLLHVASEFIFRPVLRPQHQKILRNSADDSIESLHAQAERMLTSLDLVLQFA